jgi:hypothetical protein
LEKKILRLADFRLDFVHGTYQIAKINTANGENPPRKGKFMPIRVRVTLTIPREVEEAIQKDLMRMPEESYSSWLSKIIRERYENGILKPTMVQERDGPPRYVNSPAPSNPSPYYPPGYVSEPLDSELDKFLRDLEN